MTPILLYVLATTALFYLGARATITSWLWSRYPRWLAALTDCAACSGFWYGLLVGGIGPEIGLSLVPDRLANVLVAGICSIAWTPLCATLHHAALADLGTALPEDEA